MQPLLRVRGLEKSYDLGEQKIRVLKGIDLDIFTGDFVSIMGPSGSGKSTLLHLIGLLDTPNAGTIELRGQDVSRLDANQSAKKRLETMGFVFQSFNLTPRLSALENVMMPLQFAGVPAAERRERATELLERVGLGQRLKNRPNELSGGQKQRVAIARALANNPPIVFADEPTGNLDSQTTIQIMDLFKEINEEERRTVIQVTHDDKMARYGNRIVTFKDGRIIRAQRRI